MPLVDSASKSALPLQELIETIPDFSDGPTRARAKFVDRHASGIGDLCDNAPSASYAPIRAVFNGNPTPFQPDTRTQVSRLRYYSLTNDVIPT